MRLRSLIPYIAILAYITAPAWLQAQPVKCYPADYSIPATAHNSKVAKLTKRAKRALTLTIKTHKAHRYILVKRHDQKTYRFYLSSSKGNIEAYSNGRYIILYDTTQNHYYIKRQPSPYTTRLICTN